MAVQFILSSYLSAAMAEAVYDRLDDGSYAGRIPGCPGVIAFAETLRGCEAELQAVLEDWVLLAFKLGHSLPVVDGIDLNGEPRAEPLGTL